MTDWELWACANRMRNRHGNDALAKAGERLDELYAADDREGFGVWCEIIMTRIAKLGLVVEPGQTTHWVREASLECRRHQCWLGGCRTLSVSSFRTAAQSGVLV